MRKVYFRSKRVVSLLFVAIICLLTSPNCTLPCAQADTRDYKKEEKDWQKTLQGKWDLTFDKDDVKHPVVIKLNKDHLTGSYRTQKGKFLPLQGIYLAPPHPVPAGVDPKRNPYQVEYFNNWRILFDIPMSPRPVSCRFDLIDLIGKDSFSGTSWYTEAKDAGTGQGKGSRQKEGNTGATLTRQVQ